MNGVIYARCDCPSDEEISIKPQIKQCVEFAKSKEINIIDMYIDRGVSGLTADRLEFQRMITDSKQGKFEVIIISSSNRFFRDIHKSAAYKKQLKSNNVSVLSVKGDTNEIIDMLIENFIDNIEDYS